MSILLAPEAPALAQPEALALATQSDINLYASPGAKSGYEFTAILPVYNETKRHALPGQQAGYNYQCTLEEYQVALDAAFAHRSQWRLLVVDDGSDTAAEMDVARAAGAEAITYSKPGNRGRGAAYKLGFLQAAADSRVIGAYDADGSYPPETMLDHYKAIISGADMAIAYRPASDEQHEDKRRAVAHTAMRAMREKLAYTGLKDTQAGAMAFNAEAARFLFDRSIKERWAANHQVARIAVLAGMNIAEVERTIRPRGDSRVGDSLFKLGKSAMRMVVDSTAIGLRHNRYSHLQTKWENRRAA